MFEGIKLNESFVTHLIQIGVINEEAALQALDQQRNLTQPIGRLALDRNYLTMKQVVQILQEQADSQMRFGELAITLGFMDNQQLDELLTLQEDNRPGICEILLNLGLAKESVLQEERQKFLSSMESVLT